MRCNGMIQMPDNIRKIIEGESYIVDNIGMSDSSVYLFSDKVLKVQSADEESENEYMMMKWLKGKLAIPDIIAYEKECDKSYLLMSRIKGVMSCADCYMDTPELLIEMLSKAIHMLWEVGIEGCPSRINLDKKLEMASYNVEHGLIDMENVQPDTFGEGGFKNPKELLAWLIKNRPQEELVISHGDFCLPNIFFMEGKLSGVIDLGKTCVADKYQDIALCYRSLTNNLDGRYGGKVRKKLDVNDFFNKLGISPNWEKLRYYILLDELF